MIDETSSKPYGLQSQSRRALLGGAAAISATLLASGVSARAVPQGKASPELVPFQVNIPQAALEDLKIRLTNIRWPDKETVEDQAQGVPLSDAKALVDYWINQYDWRKFEARINTYPQFRTEIDGLGVHFIHVRSKHDNALPIIMTHGWPGSIVEFLGTIDRLTNPTAHGGKAEDAFHVVIPSIPGYGFSDRPKDLGWNAERTADAWGVLMQRIGFDRWVAQGGDWGSLVTHRLAQRRPEGLIAAHVNLPLVFQTEKLANPTPEEQQVLQSMAFLSGPAGAYAHQHGTRPQTLAYGLADSPAGQAMWILEKIQAWSDNNGNFSEALSIDTVLDNISLYWFTNTAGSSARYYWEVFQTGFGNYSAGPIDLPMAASIFAHEFFKAPRSWVERAWSNLFYWNTVEHGGHFAAWEQPELFSAELVKAFSNLR
ncbi:alpha/beta fold hydrolase [Sinorhizobium meliloti]|uniref:Epoxide hydrolase 1 n=1 Tax=Sinorhizobium kummerowiae TaxID=158892 RepID=A0ABY8T8F8_9HYPH|nr:MULTISPECIES: epoxide hydrolase family protein [Sinorhizobium]MDW9416377.1 alpha/beta fold hydrolase [Sinorhizobium meliloti]MDW9482473.1 alpha/beta fold hydrolase [Sinorhizobium meliloti]MDW9513310.1 alpha/beta fold hydrolase [Sinorhizobium meliloti]MDW9594946.1 alpha/beta fold hydrolase [Sinorhizobium meliloti]MDW9637393.1 epoxide hydrolase 1 [Sinorhizobium meliloti]